ncbi:unnamed protein product [Lymnaea stagnalis]|uniref:Uncharacterized protein n=1 Tax=Lymnaea stagnalis TaxID=6523 RepID=A0AAV2IP57_LYMST
MDIIDGDLIQNPSGLASRVYGNPELVQGVHEMALKLDGRSQWIRVSGPDHKTECFGDLAHCPTGYYVGLWVQFQSPTDQKAVYMSNGGHSADGHGIAMSYSKRGLEFVFKSKDGKEWKVLGKDVLPWIWYHVAASWAKDKGLHLYINGAQVAHHQAARQTAASPDGGQYKDFVIGRSNDRTGTGSLGLMLVDDFHFISSFKSQHDMREEGPAFRYYLPMDRVTGDKLEMDGGEARVFGTLPTVPGRIGQAVSFTPRGEYIDLGDASKKCLGDFEKCKNGFYISFFIMFKRLDSERSFIFSSPHGMEIFQAGSQLAASAQSDRNTWEVRYNGLNTGIWYFVEVSWSEGGGISLYMDGVEVDRQIRERSIREPRITTEMKAFIGRSNDGGRREQLDNAELDEMNIFYGTREMLQSIGFIQTERPPNYHINFENVRGSRLLHDKMLINLIGSPVQTGGKVGRALQLDGNNDYVDFNDHTSECIGNLDLCQQGSLYSMWIRPDKLRNNMYLLSTGKNGVTLRYRNGALHASAETSTRKWETTTSSLEENKWFFVEVSFHPDRGLSLYVNNERVAEDTSAAVRTDLATPSPENNRFYLGRGNTDMSDSRYGEATYDEMDMWQADRDFLTAHEYIQRSRPRNFLIDFEELVGGDRIRHPDLNIILQQGPVLIPGKVVKNALELSGRGQFADLGRRNDECMTNLALCTQGITVAAWMRFHRFENNMVFLSTGDNGILMMYKDGYIQVTAAGRGIITTPKFETDRWYFVEVSWHPESGLKLYVDNELRGESEKWYVPPGSSTRGNFYLGLPNQADALGTRFTHGIFDVDEMEIWYGKREDLLAFGYINRDNLGYESFSFDNAEGRRILHTKYDVLLYGDASLAPGRFGNAVSLRGGGQYVDLGTHYQKCFGNLDLCSHGLTLSMWLNPKELREDTTFFSTPTYNVNYQNGRLKSEFRDRSKTWSTSSIRIRPEEWQRLTMAWHPRKGLSMYLNDELVDQDRQGRETPQQDQPASEHIYLGRSLASDRVTANMQADELQVWYDDLDQLRATGQYKVQVLPINILFNEYRNNLLRIRDREIRGFGDIRLGQGKGRDHKAIYLVGTDGYLDLGANFTCGGNLETCSQGTTIRLGLNPTSLQNNMVFLDSFPVKLYYKDNKLYGQFQTGTQLWTVSTLDFRPGQWQRVELTWHPREGLTMYIDGIRVDQERYPIEQTPQMPADWRTYFGRALQGGKTYANTGVDSIEFWTAHRDDLPEDKYLRIPLYQPSTPRPTDDSIIITESKYQTPAPERRRVKILVFDGKAYATFNFDNLSPRFLQRTNTEDFQFYFLSRKPNGLIWLQEDRDRKMYLALREGNLVFVNDDGSGAPEEIPIGRQTGTRFDDGGWHLFKLRRNGRNIKITVDDGHEQNYNFARDVHFLTGGSKMYLAGTQNTYESTNGQIRDDLNGGMALVIYRKDVREGNDITKLEVNMISEITTSGSGVSSTEIDWGSGGRTQPPTGRPPITPRPTPAPTPRPRPPPSTPAPVPAVTSITLKNEGHYFRLQEPLSAERGNSLSLKFQTIKDRGLILYATSNLVGKNFIALEIYDGKLYFVHNFGGRSKRTLLSDREVSDGQSHEFSLRFHDNLMALTVDGENKRIPLEANEQWPRNLSEYSPINVGGHGPYLMPWHTWARTGYLGCIEDLRINNRLIGWQGYIQSQQLYGIVDATCTAMPRDCSTRRPCVRGYCINKWGGYTCDCRATEFTGEQCETAALTGIFNGNTNYKMTITPTQNYHVNDISFRLRTFASDGLIFQTKANLHGTFLRAELEGGRIKLTTNLGGEEQSFFVGGAVNDNQWHTVFIQRRGNQMEFWVDNEKHFTKILPGEDYFLHVDNVYVGGSLKGELDIPSTIKPFIGYLQNFYFSDIDVFSKINSAGGGNFSTGTNVTPIIFNDVTFTSYQTHLVLQPQYLASGLDINFIFKTKDPNGVILFSEGKDNQLFAVELFNGQLHVKVDIPGKAPLRISTPVGRSLNDGNWHSLSLMTHTVDGHKQLIMTVDDLRSTNTYSLLDQINLQGPLYLGGITEALYQKQNIKEFLSSKAGYRGCLASVGLGKTNPDLYALGQSQNVNILRSCQDIVSQCTKTTCNNGGVCHDHHNNGTTWCDCSKTAYAGPTCTDEPLGYYFRPQGRQYLDGMLVYRYPPLDQGYNEQDEIILGVMTEEKNAVLTKLISDIFNDYVEIKLVNGYVVATYDTDGKGASTITNSDVDISDGRYHIIRFLRTKDKGTLMVDSNIAVNTHANAHGNFDRPNKIFIGGIYQGKKIVSGTGFGGIIGGLYVNGRLIFPYASDNVNVEFYSDVEKAAHPFKLGKIVTAPPVIWDTTTTPYIPIVTPTPAPPGPFLPILPDDIGGGGIAWEGSAGGTGVNVVVYPGGGGGSAGTVPGVMPGPIDGEVAAAQIGVVPSLPTVGPRAGAVMGTILGLAALASSLMWAFYRCKPGWCTCLKPPAAPLTISTPRSTTNMAAVQAASAGAGGAGAGAGGVGAGAGGAGAGVDVVDAGVLTGGIKASSSAGQGFGAGSTLYSQQSSSNVHQRSDSYDSATLRATGTFTNKGTAIGTPRMGRHQIGSTTSASASGYSESNAAITPASLQSYHFEGGNSTADYDIASGVHSNYQSNTLNAGGGGGGGGFSTSTMSSNYNYSVQTIRSVGGQQALLGYAAGSTSNVIVTPGAMGEKVRVDCCLMTNDGHSVVTGSSLGPPQVWNMSSGELLRIMQGETVGSTNLHLVCNDRLLVGAINDDLEINQYSTPKGVHNYQFQIWDFASGRPLGMAQSEMCSALTVMSDNDKVVFGRSDKFGGGTNIVVWDLLGNQAIKEMRYDAPVGNNDYISYISLSQNDRYVIAGFNNTFDNFAEFVIFDMTLTSYNISDPNILRLDAAPEVTAILPHDEAVTGLRNGDLVVWSLRTGNPSRQLLSNTGKHAHSREVKAVARSDDNKYLVSASADGTLKVWDLESERHISTMNGHNDEVWCACISSDNEIVVSGSRDITIRLWRLKTGQEICAFNAGVDVFYITMSKDKGTIVALGDKFGARKLIMLQVVRSKVKRQVLA